MNGVYDPLLAVGGPACTGFPELAAIYSRYRVYGCKISLWGYSTCVTPFMVYIWARSNLQASCSNGNEMMNKAMEYSRGVKFVTVRPYGANTGYPTFRLSKYQSIKALEGPKAMVDEDWQADSTTYPAKQCYWDVGMCALDGTATAVTANVLVRITYYVKFVEPNVDYNE